MAKRISLVIVADVRLYRDGLASILDQRHEVRVLGTAADCAEARALFSSCPDVIILDVATHGSRHIADLLTREMPGARVIAFGVQNTDREILTYAEASLSGYVPCSASIEDLVVVIESAMRDEVYCSARTSASLFRRVGALAGGIALPRRPKVPRRVRLGCTRRPGEKLSANERSVCGSAWKAR
jgi:two-component system nitrate/nitrite response regulator NarL